MANVYLPRIFRQIIRAMAGLSVCFAGIILAYSSAKAEIKASEYDKLFPRAPEVQEQAEFWYQVFYRFPASTTLIHDADKTSNVLDVIDHNLLERKASGTQHSPAKRTQLNELYLKRYRLALRRFHHLGKRAIQFGGIEKRVFSVYSRSEEELMRLYKGEVSLRTQTGLADEFIRAAERAQDYLPYMEKSFVERGVPTRLTRLPFVESMFNLKAVSKVGASGIWQFMPDTARNYMFVNRYHDERNSPLKASRAAARLMSDNYAALKSWPLAITAYNHGRGGMERAARTVGSRDLGKIIRNYRANSFGFASKNFYAEFLAAADVYDVLVAEQKVVPRPSNLNIAVVRVNKPLSVHHILQATNLTKENLQELNPCLKDRSFTQNKYRPLPKAYEIFVPREKAKKLNFAMSKAPRNLRLASIDDSDGEPQ